MKLILLSALAISIFPPLAYAEPLFAKPDLSDGKIHGPKECWVVQKDGVLLAKSVASKQGSILWTKENFKNFEFEGEFKYTGHVDSGVFLRTEIDQIQIGISGSLKRDMTGSPYIAKTSKYPKEADVKDLLKEGEWNKLTIRAVGPRYVVILNGRQVLDWVSETAVEEGPVGLQVHPGLEMKIEFRNLKIKSLPQE